jgi:phospholipase/carboxylesterase
MSGLAYLERPAAGEPEGLWLLHHGRGADAHDLLEAGGLAVDYRETDGDHSVGPAVVPDAIAWLAAATGPDA